MRAPGIGLISLLLCLVLGWACLAAPDSDEADEVGAPLATDDEAGASQAREEPPQRVIVQINRYESLRGRLVEEDGDLLVVRDLEGDLHSMHKSRVLKIIRLVEPLPGQQGTVVLKDGERRYGQIVEDAFDHVIIEVEGIRAKLVRDIVEFVVLDPTFDELYARYRDALEQSYVPERHLLLCKWLVDQREYELAKEELEALLARTSMPQAHQLLRLVNAQLTLRPRPERDDGFELEDHLPDEDAEPPSAQLPQQIISADDVNLIRVYEIDFRNPPRVAVPTETVRTMIESYSESEIIPASHDARTALFRADPLQIVYTMFRLRARELYSQVDVLTEPHSLNLFRQRVHNTWLMNNCATSRCHGGPNAGRFFLHRRNYKDERVRYTNLLILERLDLDDDWKLVNYEEPMHSLVIQYGLPRTDARKPHPPVRGWEPVFTRSNSRMLEGTIEWIDSMLRPRPEYPIVYEPPVLDDVTAGSETGESRPKPDRQPR